MPQAPFTTPGARAADDSIGRVEPRFEHPAEETVIDPGDETVIPVVAEQLDVSSRSQPTGAVRVRVEVEHGSQVVHAHNVVHTVCVQHVPRGVPVDEARPPWNEGDTLVVPVYEERLVLERRLVLKEEIHIVRQTVRQPVERRMPVRQERAIVERRQPDGQWRVEPIESSPPNAGDRDNPKPERTEP